MRTSTVATAALLSLMLTPAWSAAQTLDEIASKHIAARGGREKLAAIQTVKITRTVGSGIETALRVLLFKKRPNVLRVEQGPAQPGAAMTSRGINENAVWDTVQGKAVARDAQLAAEARDVDGDFDGLLENLPRSPPHRSAQPAKRPPIRCDDRLRQLARRRRREVPLRHHRGTHRERTRRDTRHLHGQDRDQRPDERVAVLAER